LRQAVNERRRSVEAAVKQHHVHIAGRIYKQLRNAEWILTVEETRDVQDWRPDVAYLPVQRVPFDVYPTDERRKHVDQVLADNEIAEAHNDEEAWTEPARQIVLRHLEQRLRHQQNHEGRPMWCQGQEYRQPLPMSRHAGKTSAATCMVAHLPVRRHQRVLLASSLARRNVVKGRPAKMFVYHALGPDRRVRSALTSPRRLLCRLPVSRDSKYSIGSGLQSRS
jgi:hypothetical protein